MPLSRPPVHPKMTTRTRFASGILFFAATALTAQQPSLRGVTAEDYYAYHFAGDPRISPDGKQVAYEVSRVDRARNRRVPSIWVTTTDGSGSPRELVGEAWNPGAPRWSPDGGTVSFSSNRASADSTVTTG
jgi:dipeptidyl aminopeptidase/acylaminoacyl peptidase